MVRWALALVMVLFAPSANAVAAGQETVRVNGLPIMTSSPTTFIFRIFDSVGRPNKDLIVPIKELSTSDFAAMSVAEKEGQRVDLTLFRPRGGPAMGLLSDCAEKPLTFQTIKETADQVKFDVE